MACAGGAGLSKDEVEEPERSRVNMWQISREMIGDCKRRAGRVSHSLREDLGDFLDRIKDEKVKDEKMHLVLCILVTYIYI